MQDAQQVPESVYEEPVLGSNDRSDTQPTQVPTMTETGNEEAHLDPERPRETPVDLERLAMEQRVQELEEIVAAEQTRLRLRELEAIIAMRDRGDPMADAAIKLGALPPPAPVTSSPNQRPTGSKLPRPEAPYKFAKKNRAEYNRWERECENFHLREPLEFSTDVSKIAFGVEYLSESARATWSEKVRSQQADDPLWQPTWAYLKEVMLNTLGNENERGRRAAEAVQRARLRPNQSPSELLEYLRPLWAEQPWLPDKSKATDFYNALPANYQKDLLFFGENVSSDLALLEEKAGELYRLRPTEGRKKETQPRGSQPKRKTESQGGDEGDEKTPKKAKRGRKWPSEPSRVGKPNADRRSTIICHNCNESGHIARNCPQPRKPKEGLSHSKENGHKH